MNLHDSCFLSFNCALTWFLFNMKRRFKVSVLKSTKNNSLQRYFFLFFIRTFLLLLLLLLLLFIRESLEVHLALRVTTVVATLRNIFDRFRHGCVALLLKKASQSLIKMVLIIYKSEKHEEWIFVFWFFKI